MPAARQVARSLLDGVERVSGLRLAGHVPRVIAEDARELAAYLSSPVERRRERADGQAAATTGAAFDFSRAHFGTGPVQHRREIARLMDRARENGTRVACEIGAYDSGTSVVFSRLPDLDTLIVMDLYVKNRWRLRRHARPGQSIHIIDGDTTHPLTAARLRRRLGGRRVDLLLIDGDHAWAGVRHDFLVYRALVRPGGLIAFHDICEVRHPDSHAWAGDVPRFWTLVRSLYPSEEFVDWADQEGFGLGVIRYDPDRSVAAIEAALTP